MSETEYFRQASLNADFRQAKILEQREQKKFFRGFLVFGAALVVILTAVTGLADGKWLLGVPAYTSMLIVPAMLYSTARTRLAALEAMEKRGAASGNAAGAVTTH